MTTAVLEQQAGAAASFLKLLANRERLLILYHLSHAATNVSNLEGMVQLSQSALSQHLAKLREQGLVQAERRGQQVYYAVADHKVRRMLGTLHALYAAA